MTIESAFFFECEEDALPGILTLPVDATSVGVLIVVGGPQYRVGSHRQFVQLSRAFAEAGVACMRFDCRGMGDADGEPRAFDELGQDIHAALAAFRDRVPGLQRVVLLGLCDGATAAALFSPDRRDIAGLLLINPWVRTEVGASRTFLRHYYFRRLLDRALWRKLASGQLGVVVALRRLVANARNAMKSAYAAAVKSAGGELPERMLSALSMAACPCVVLLSGRDFVAREFEDSMKKLSGFGALLDARLVTVEHVPDADHTFSGVDSAAALQRICVESVHVMMTPSSACATLPETKES